MPSPVMNEQVFESGGSVGVMDRPAPAAAAYHPGQAPPPQYPPVTATQGRTMSFGGTATAAGVMLVVLLAGGWFGWQQVSEVASPTQSDPTRVVGQLNNAGWLWISLIVGFGLAIFTAFKPMMARFTSLPYAIAEGVLLGVISHLYNTQTQGIAIQAILATAGVFLVMLVLYGLRILRATPKFTKGVIAATFGIAFMYLIGWITSLFTSSALTFFNSPSLLSIGFSLVIVGVASMNLILDFDMIEKGVRNGAPAAMDWYGAFGLTVTLVWLYLEMLRLLSKLQSR
jgi:uncharacterized YccA/Bax inhibitor family protein